MNDQQKRAARAYLDELIRQVPNFVSRVASGELRASAVSGAAAAVSQVRRNTDRPNLRPTYGLLPQEAEFVVEEFLSEMQGGRLGPQFRIPTEED